MIGWYTFDVTDAVNRWLKVKANTKSTKIFNHLMIEKGRMAVVKKSIKNANSAKRDHSLVPDGVFEKASLYVYSEDAKHKKTREKRAASYGSRRHHNSRRRQKGRNRGHYNCRRHKQYVDFMEVIRIDILFFENKFILELYRQVFVKLHFV